MAVPGRLVDEDDVDDGGVEDGILAEQEEEDNATDPAIKALASAASRGDVDALRLALGATMLRRANNHKLRVGPDKMVKEFFLHCPHYGKLDGVDGDNLNGSINEPVEDGDTPLHLSCLYGNFPCVQLLIERGADIEVKDEDGAIPLHDACAGGYYNIVELLLNNATSPDKKKRMLDTADYEGDTPLHHAARGDHDNVVRLLLDNGASPTTKNAYDKIPYNLTEPPSPACAVFEEFERRAVQ
ncbi:BRCA1-associated RING domain protein 1-like protein [Drosera capensis]